MPFRAADIRSAGATTLHFVRHLTPRVPSSLASSTDGGARDSLRSRYGAWIGALTTPGRCSRARRSGAACRPGERDKHDHPCAK
jgi:hypothetical protein